VTTSVPAGRKAAWINFGAWDKTAAIGVLAAVVVSLIMLAPLLVLAGVNVGDGYRVLFGASAGSSFAFTSLLLSTTPLLITALGVTLAYRAGTFNVGGDGQIIIGAATAVLLFPVVDGLPVVLGVLVMVVAGTIVGFLWGAVAGLLKKWRSVSEIISTIMLNMLALLVVQYLVSGPLKGKGLQYAASGQAPTNMWLGNVGIGAVMIPVGFVIAVILVVLISAYTYYSGWGWRQRLVGISGELAARQRLKVTSMQAYSLALSGGMAGLAGVLELLGNQHRVGYTFSPGWGFDGLAIALLAQGRFPAVFPLALYFGALHNGSQSLQSELGLSGNFVLLLVGLPVVVAAALIGYANFSPRARRAPASQTKEA
jgi:ABC-type uncharacterized transport system permease subunit